jgi:hypothetical protein
VTIEVEDHTGFWTPGRIVVTILLVCFFGFWIWAFSPWVPRGNPDRLEDRAFPVAAEAICGPIQARISDLEPAAEATSPADRADTVDEGTALVAAMVEELAGTVTGTDHDRELLGKWLGDWREYVSEREDFGQRLRDEGDVPFLSRDAGRGVSHADRLNGFARVNDMDSCETPKDV